MKHRMAVAPNVRLGLEADLLVVQRSERRSGRHFAGSELADNVDADARRPSGCQCVIYFTHSGT
jgi:hypothetical protein